MKREIAFKETRIQRHNEIVEDYTEMIADLIESKGKARICDIAKQMGISHVSVLKTIKKLIRDGYLESDVHPLILLTEKGKETALFSKRKHVVLSQFLLKLGIPEEIVAIDVEGIEHHISPETLKALEAFVPH